jgi:hypothetical protein
VGGPVSGRCNKLIVEVAANERHERPASGMDAANRQPSGKVSNLRVIARQNLELQLGCGFPGEAGMLLSETGCLRLAATINAKQHQRRWAGDSSFRLGRFFTHDDSSWNQKGTRLRVPRVHGLRLSRCGLSRPSEPYRSASHEKLH